MKKYFSTLSLPLFLVLLLGLTVALANVIPGTYLSGWDNTHSEFNLGSYAHQVLFGAWLEHEGTGGPAAQVHASNIFRLPILYLLFLLVPQSLERYAFVFLMYLIGGVGMFLYLKMHWLPKDNKLSLWLAALGAAFYLLNPLTLQQFYIIFEMFAVQFAFLPFVLLSLHALSKKTSTKTIAWFSIVQLLIAPSAYQPAVFYLGMLFSCTYVFFLNFNWKHMRKAIVLTSLVFGLTVFLQSYWIVPNVYFALHNAHHVSESKANGVFKYESLESIRSEGDLASFLTGIHYLFDWKDYNFSLGSHEFIFSEWNAHFIQALPGLLLVFFGMAVIVGFFTTITSKDKGAVRFGFVLWYVVACLLIWMDLFPARSLVDWLYGSELFFEIFRNPFTKLTVILAFLWTVFFVQCMAFVVAGLQRFTRQRIWQHRLRIVFLFIVFGLLIVMMKPIFQGHFINEKLRIAYPEAYSELFAYLNDREPFLRILELPYYSLEGFEYYDWQFLGKGNGYQGLGFEFFGVRQPFLIPDFARWTTSTDSFYFELRQALDGRNADQVSRIFDKYQVDLVIVDQSKINSYTTKHDYPYELLLARAGLVRVWSKDFLTVYERQSHQLKQKDGYVFVPTTVERINSSVDRTFEDLVYRAHSDYIEDDEFDGLQYPFAHLLKEEVLPSSSDDQTVVFHAVIPQGTYTLTVPRTVSGDVATLPALIDYSTETLRIEFGEATVQAGDITIELPKLRTIFARFDQPKQLMIRFNEEIVVIEPGKIKLAHIPLTSAGLRVFLMEDGEKDVVIDSQVVSWSEWTTDQTTTIHDVSEVKIHVKPLWLRSDLIKPVVNCGTPKRGVVAIKNLDQGVAYSADGYGVACAGTSFEGVTTAMSFMARFLGENINGRSTKLFINDQVSRLLTKQMLLPQGNFEVFYALPQSSNQSVSQLLFNWETRSFKTQAENNLADFSITPLPLWQMAGIQLKPVSSSAVAIQNSATIEGMNSFDVAFQLLRVECQTSNCFVGLNQSYDDGWVAWDLTHFRSLPHHTMNGWANGWQLVTSGTVLIIYVPELVAMSLLLAVIGFFGWLSLTMSKEHASHF